MKERIALGSVGIFSFLNMILNDFFYHTTLILIHDVLSALGLYYIQFKEVKVIGAGGRTTQTPNFLMRLKKSYWNWEIYFDFKSKQT